MTCKVITQFRAKPGHADNLLGLLRKYVPESARHAGCLEISIQQNQDDPNDVISNQYWETRKHYDDYFAWRADQGVDAQLQSQCSEPSSVRFFSEIIAAKPNPTMPTNSLVEEQKEVVRQFFQRYSAGDIPGAISLFREDASYWLPTTRETLGISQLPGALKFVQSRLDGPIRYKIGTMIAEQSKIAVQVEGFGKTVEGAPYNNLYHVYFELEGCKIVHVREYNDTALVFATLRAGQRRPTAAADSITKD